MSVKIRLGWDHSSLNYLEVADAAVRGGAQWLTIHGRTRSDSYAEPVHLEKIAELKQTLAIPVLGNGNVFSAQDAQMMQKVSGVDGVMLSRGALGNPWLFAQIKGASADVSLGDWLETVLLHCQWQEQAYGTASALAAVCMRKHLLWYVSGWPKARKLRDAITRLDKLSDAGALLRAYAAEISEENPELLRMSEQTDALAGQRFLWDPKFEMDRQHDRGVGDEVLEAV